ncbi:MAG: hypothetical protein HW387_849 [Parachlamydiales bacterium]|nr:hypothetical protein [Parachlamydiales bacterium]
MIKKTVCLNMIVKNESAVIQRCLDSVKEIIDYWVIVDTGSTDGTQAIVQDVLKGIPGELHERLWVNFEHNRNEALALAKDHGDYFLFLDADDRLVFRGEIKWPDLVDDYYLAAHRHGTRMDQRILLVHSQLDWKWEGIVHEAIMCPEALHEAVLEDPYVLATQEGFRSKNLLEKFLSDAQILEQAIQDDPTNKRYVFHLAGSYAAAGNLERALKYFNQRIALGDSTLEVFFSLYQKAVIERELGFPTEEFIQSYIRAYLCRPTRAEPFFCLADHYMKNDCYLLGYLFSKCALMISDTKDCFNNQFAINDYGLLYQLAECAGRIGNYQEAYEALKQLLLVENLPSDIREASEKNLALPLFDSYRG